MTQPSFGRDYDFDARTRGAKLCYTFDFNSTDSSVLQSIHASKFCTFVTYVFVFAYSAMWAVWFREFKDRIYGSQGE